MRARRTAVALCVVSALAATIYLIFKYEGPVYIAPTVGAISLVLSVLVLVYNYWSRGHASDQSETSTPEQADAAAEWLAGAVAGGWREEAVARRIVTPAPVSVRWRWVGTLSPGEARRPSAAGAGPSPLPGSSEAGEILTSGVVTKLHDELYARLPRGRLVIRGDPGSGKTGALVLLLLEALARRKKLVSDERQQVPVPVLLPLSGWDPASVSLTVWAATVLNRDYQALRSPHYGGDAASALIRFGRVALFLDGLDEMPDGLRAQALRRIDTEVPGLRVVVTSRSGEYAEAIREVSLDSAAVIELCPVRPTAAAKFLLRDQAGDNRAEWEKVADYIKANPGSPAAKTLDSPLNLTMARDAYATGDPTVIIDPSSFPTEERITAHLTGQFLARTYPDRLDQRWLGSLARHLGGQGGKGPHDLEWWRLGGMLSPATRILAVTLATAVVGTLVDWTIEMPIFLAAGGRGLKFGFFDGLMVGPLFGITFGFAYAIVVVYGKVKVEPSEIPLRLSDLRAIASAFRPRNHTSRAASGFLSGFMGGIGYAMVLTLSDAFYFGANVLDAKIVRTTFINMAIFSIIFGLAAGISFLVLAIFEKQSDTGVAATPLSLLAESRARAPRQMVVLALLSAIVIAAGGWVAFGLLRGLPGSLDWWVLVVGGITGGAGSISYALAFTAWGQWLLLARIVLPLTGRLPWGLPAFLDDAYKRGVLRQAGAVYQFRHATIQAYLSRGEGAGDGGGATTR